MAENVYLRSQRDQYSALKKSIEGLQARAAEGKRDLTNEELRSVIEMGEKAQLLFTQIENLTDIELRNAKVADILVRPGMVVTLMPTSRPKAGPTSAITS